MVPLSSLEFVPCVAVITKKRYCPSCHHQTLTYCLLITSRLRPYGFAIPPFQIRHMFTFNKKYFLLTLLLFITEVLIALFVHDRFIRPYVGDYLVVMLIYCAVRTFLQAPVVPTALGVLLFSYLIELLQYLNFVAWIGWTDNAFVSTVIGTSFAWWDMLAYTLGVLTIVLLEWRNIHLAT